MGKIWLFLIKYMITNSRTHRNTKTRSAELFTAKYNLISVPLINYLKERYSRETPCLGSNIFISKLPFSTFSSAGFCSIAS